MRHVLTTVLLLLPPAGVKNLLLRLVGHRVHRTARVGTVLALKLRQLEMAPGSRIGSGTVIRDMNLVSLGTDAMIGQLNWISGRTPLGNSVPDGCTLQLRDGAWMTSRHYLDCLGGIVFESRAAMMGVRTTVFTHTRDYRDNRTRLAGVRLGANSAVSTCCTLLAGTTTGEGSLLAASTTTRLDSHVEAGMLYGGVPAKPLRSIDGDLLAHGDQQPG